MLILMAYSTVDGHTRKIAERIAASLESEGHRVTIAPLTGVTADALARHDLAVIGASIRYGKHRPAVYAFIRQHRRWLEQTHSAFFSVDAVSRKAGKDAPERNPNLKGLRATGWQPAALAIFAGKIDYRRYSYVERQAIRLIMLLTGGPTAVDACVEFTDWGKVDAFARRLAAPAPLKPSGCR